MRVLIIFGLIGAAFGSQVFGPLSYSAIAIDSPKPSFEYGSSVQTPSYNNYAYVRSGPEFERKFLNVAEPAPAFIAGPQSAILATRFAEPQPAVLATRFAEPQPAVLATRFAEQAILPQANLVEIKSTSAAEIVKSAIPSPLPTSLAAREFPLAAPAVALPTTKLYSAPIATFEAPKFLLRSDASSFVAAAPIAPATKLIVKSEAPAFIASAPAAIAPAAIEAPKLLLRSDAPAFVAPTISATPAQIVDTFVEQKQVGEGILERRSQYHTQNELGEATYGHREPLQAHDAVQDAAGNKAGSFSYVSSDGRLLQTDYVADQDGYRVKSNALPSAPVVEVKSRKRRSIAIAAPAFTAPAFAAPTLVHSLPLVAPSRRIVYNSPSLYSGWPTLGTSYVSPLSRYSW